MYRQNQKLFGLCEPVVSGLGYELLGIEHINHSTNVTLRLYIDAEAGITVDDCARVSHQVTGVLDVEDPISGKYILEVSSPGLDRPIFSLKQFESFIGHKAKLRLLEKVDGKKNLRGVIEEVNEDSVGIGIGDEILVIPESMIDKANLIYED